MRRFLKRRRDDASLAIVMSQACIVTMTVFAGGLFRPFEEVNGYSKATNFTASHGAEYVLALHVEGEHPIVIDNTRL